MKNLPSKSRSAKRSYGRILKIKSGFNPNSSSVGSEIPVFLFFAVTSGAVAVVLMNTLAFFDRQIRKKRTKEKQ
jgi:H+/Cl- antiporter ClcA